MKNSEERQAALYFCSRTIGRNLREIAVDLIQTEADDVVSRWFHSHSETDLYTWVDKRQNVLKQQLSFFGQIVEWNCVEGLKTGVVVESEMESPKQTKSKEDLVVKPSETVQFDTQPQLKTIELAVDILSNMEAGDQDFRSQLVTNFKNPQTLGTMGGEAVMAKFGLSLKNYQTGDHGFWEALKKRFQNLFTNRD